MKDVNEHIDSGCRKLVTGESSSQNNKRRNATKNAWSSMLGGPSSRNDGGIKGKGKDRG